MGTVPAPRKSITPEMRRDLTDALRARDKAETHLWALCAEAVAPGQGTYEQVSEILGIAKSTLQNKVREARKP